MVTKQHTLTKLKTLSERFVKDLLKIDCEDADAADIIIDAINKVDQIVKNVTDKINTCRISDDTCIIEK
jgi:hypothetical protein